MAKFEDMLNAQIVRGWGLSPPPPEFSQEIQIKYTN